MSRRISYAAIAAAFAINKPVRHERPSGFEQWKTDVLAIADVLQTSSPKFNRKRFLTAAGVLEDSKPSILDRFRPEPLSDSARSQHFIDTGRRV